MFKSDQQEQSLPVAESTPVANMQLSRRQFMVTGVQSGAALMLGVTVGQEALAATGTLKGNAAALQPNAFVCITPDNQVCITIKHLEMGQGTFTGLATLVAEELDASWSQVTCEGAEANAGKYANLAWGKFQGTGGSTAIANAFMQMREAGASARAMLVSAAASLWQVPAREIKVSNGVVSHPASGKQSEFGALAELAAMQKIPEKVILKKSDQFTLIGKKLPRKDVGKTTGQALYTQDMQQPGTLTALVAHPPRFGAKMLSFDASAAEKQKGVVAVVALENRVAVLAKDFWQAKKARDLLVIKWDEQAAFKQSSADLLADYKALADKPGLVAHQTGSIAQGFDQADKVIEAEYAFPFLAHAAMEPMNCVVQLRKQGDKILGAELWYGAQMHTGDQMALAGLLQVAPEQVKINTLYAGGSFGRRANSKADYVLEAAEIAKAYGGDVPVKLVWTREDDTRAGYFRPMYFHKLKAGLDKSGNIVAWQHRIVGQSIVKGTGFEFLIQNGIDHTSVEGASNLPYAIPNMQVELHSPEIPVPVLWWRSVGSTHTAHATETFLDELATAAGKDPVALRMSLLEQHPRHRGVLKMAAEKANWTAALPENHYRGVAVHKSFGTYVAQVVEVSRQGDAFKVEKVTCAVDCGVPVNPDIIRAQMEGGIGFGLSPAMMSAITFDQGRVVESNFHDYQVLRAAQMPKIDVHIVASAEPPSGVGEPGTPVVAPALANAIAAASGRWMRDLPMQVEFV